MLMKILLILYVIGIICGVLGNLIIRLEVASYIKDKRKQGAINKTDWRVSIAGSIKTIVQILMPVYHYFIYWQNWRWKVGKMRVKICSR